jgi:hypothetical protein
MTTGSYNTILGGFSGNQGGLNITTSSNYIVLSDGAGNPWAYYNGSSGAWRFGTGGSGSSLYGGAIALNASSAAGSQPIINGYGNSTLYWSAGTKGYIDSSSSTAYEIQVGGTGGVYLASGGTSWTAASDERVKENLVEITDAATKLSSLRTVIGNYIWDKEKVRRPFLIAQDVQAVLPEAVDSSNPEELGVAYSDVIPLLVAAIKEQQAIITQMQATLKSAGIAGF